MQISISTEYLEKLKTTQSDILCILAKVLRADFNVISQTSIIDASEVTADELLAIINHKRATFAEYELVRMFLLSIKPIGSAIAWNPLTGDISWTLDDAKTIKRYIESH